jgi:hypothetical protein
MNLLTDPGALSPILDLIANAKSPVIIGGLALKTNWKIPHVN